MFSISKIVTYIFLPPGIFVVLILISLVLLLFTLRILKPGSHKTHKGSHPNTSAETRPNTSPGARTVQFVIILLTLSGISLYLLSIEPVSELLLRPLEEAHPPLSLGSAHSRHTDAIDTSGAGQNIMSADAIVVLGGGTVSRSPEEGGAAAPGVETLKRLSFAYRLHRITGLPIITTGGTPLSARTDRAHQISAGSAMGRYLIALGAEPQAIRTEESSRNTFENATLVSEKYAPGKVVLVTSAYHIPRSVWVFEHIGLQVLPAPTDYKIDKDGYNVWSFFPTIGALHDSYRALHEYVGILYYVVRF